MKRIALLATAALAVGCSLFTRDNVRTVVSDAQIACAITNAILGDATIRHVCAIADGEWQIIAPYLAEHRKALLREHTAMKAGKCAAVKP